MEVAISLPKMVTGLIIHLLDTGLLILIMLMDQDPVSAGKIPILVLALVPHLLAVMITTTTTIIARGSI